MVLMSAWPPGRIRREFAMRDDEVAFNAFTDPTPDGGVSPHTVHYGEGTLYQDSAETTVADADGDPIGSTVNGGSDSHSLTQATTAAKPTLKLNVLNGRAVFRFDGGDSVQGAFGGGGLSIPQTAFLVAKHDGGVIDARSLLDGDDLTNRAEFRIFNRDYVFFNMGYNENDVNTNWYIFVAINASADERFWRSGELISSSRANEAAPDGLTIGAAYDGSTPWIGDMAAALLYPGYLSITDVNSVASYLADYYDLTWSDIA